jgi:hypothetical protein
VLCSTGYVYSLHRKKEWPHTTEPQPYGPVWKPGNIFPCLVKIFQGLPGHLDKQWANTDKRFGITKLHYSYLTSSQSLLWQIATPMLEVFCNIAQDVGHL